MSLRGKVDTLYNAAFESGAIRYTTAPAAAAPVAIVSNGVVAAWAWPAYIQIVAAGAIPDPCWLVGIVIHTPAVESHNGDIAIASGAAAAEVDLAILHYNGVWPAAGGATALAANEAVRALYGETIWLPYPIRINGSPRLAGRVRKSSGASAAGVSVKAILASAVGT